MKKYRSNDEMGFCLTIWTLVSMIAFATLWTYLIEPVLFVASDVPGLFVASLAFFFMFCIGVSATIFIKNEDKNNRAHIEEIKGGGRHGKG